MLYVPATSWNGKKPRNSFTPVFISGDMERHELKHTGERPFSCDQCSQTFTRLQYLREHQNIHLGRRPYRCVICNMAFHDFASCHRHVNRHKVSDAQQPTQQIHVEFPPDVSTGCLPVCLSVCENGGASGFVSVCLW